MDELEPKKLVEVNEAKKAIEASGISIEAIKAIAS